MGSFGLYHSSSFVPPLNPSAPNVNKTGCSLPTACSSQSASSSPPEPWSHVNPRPSVPNTVSSRVYEASEVRPGQLHNVVVSHVQNGLRKFTVQLNEAPHGLSLLREELDKLKRRPIIHPVRGAPCLAIFSQDKLLHRGLITSIQENNACQVYYVDYGNTEVTDVHNIFEIPDEFVGIHLYAVRVGLADPEELEQFERVGEIFTRIVLGKPFQCLVVDGDDPVPKVNLLDKAGRNLKDVLISTLNMIQASKSFKSSAKSFKNPCRLGSADPAPAVRISLERVPLKLSPPLLNPEEGLLVTHVDEPGKFFGQLERRLMQDMRALRHELSEMYDREPSPPLLYADVLSHIGDFAVVKSKVDDAYYRVQVIEELPANDVLVNLVDYGNNEKVQRCQVLAPFNDMVNFTQPAFGIECQVDGVTLKKELWYQLVHGKAVSVKFESCDHGSNKVTFVDHPNNQKILAALAPKTLIEKALLLNLPASPAPVSESGPSKTASESWRANNQGLASGSEIRNVVGNETGSINVLQKTGLEPMRTQQESSSASPLPPKLPLLATALREQFPPHRAVRPLVYLQQPILKGVVKSAEVVFVQDPQDFYCQLSEAFDSLDELMNQLATAYRDPTKPGVSDVKPGMACVALYSEDGEWYRAQVVSLEASHVQVFFVDYGNHQKCSVSELKAIDEDFVKMPPQAYHCRLTGIIAPASWADGDKLKLEARTISKRLKVKFVGQALPEIYSVVVAEEVNGVHSILNELYGYPKSFGIPCPSCGYLSLPVPNGPLTVYVSWFQHLERFFVTPVDRTAYKAKMELLEDFYSSLGKTTLLEDEPGVGLPCVTRFSEDQRFYRAQIVQIRGKFAQVLFIDYGNVQETPLDQLKRIVPTFLELPQLTWQCCLRGVRSCVPKKPERQKYEAACFLTGQPVQAVFHDECTNKDGSHPVEMESPDVGSFTNYLRTNGVVIPDFVPDQIISEKACVSYTTDLNRLSVLGQPSGDLENADSAYGTPETASPVPDHESLEEEYIEAALSFIV